MLATIISSAPPTWQDYALTFGQMLAALAVMAAAAWAVTRLGRRGLAGRDKRRLGVIDKLPLESNRSLWLVELEGRRLLIGSSQGSVRLLCEIPASEQNPSDSTEKTTPTPSDASNAQEVP